MDPWNARQPGRARASRRRVTELDGLRKDNEVLRQRNELLERQAVAAAQAFDAFDAFARDEVDEVGIDLGAPLLLRRAQAQLRGSRQLLRAIFDAALDSILLADDVGTYVDANPAACRLFGLPRAQLLGRSIVEFAAPDIDSLATFRELAARGSTSGVFAIRRLDGTTAMVDYNAVANVVPGRHLSILRDISDRQATEDALRRLHGRGSDRFADLRVRGRI